MSTKMTRRGAMAGAAAVPVALATPAIGGDHPDADLIELWDRWKALEDKIKTHDRAYRDADEARDRERADRLWSIILKYSARQRGLVPQIALETPATLEGALLQLRVAAAYDGRIDCATYGDRLDDASAACQLSAMDALERQIGVHRPPSEYQQEMIAFMKLKLAQGGGNV